MTVVTLEPAGRAPDTGQELARVQQFFGDHVIIDWTGPADQAPRYAAAMERRFGLPAYICPVRRQRP